MQAIHTMTLGSGHRLAWSEFGHPHGYPVLYMHRQAGCRLEALFLHKAALSAGFRLIAVDRPGLGGSDFFSFRDGSDLAGSFVQLMDHLQLRQVALLSWGAGSHFALALAAREPQRISFINLLAPSERGCALVKRRAVRIPLTLAVRTLLFCRSRLAAVEEERYFTRLREQLCYMDRKLIDDPWIRSVLAAVARESLRKGTAGAAQDICLSLSAPTIRLDSVAPELPVHLWAGSADTFTAPFRPGPSRAGLSRDSTQGVRHWLHRQGHLFFTQAADDVFDVVRRALIISPAAAVREYR